MTLSDLLASVRRVELRTSRLVNDMMVGAYLSLFKGRGMDFEELREYMPGDEVRDIDWNVTYRMGRPFVKRFREERELTMVLAVDVSGSSVFGSSKLTKRQFAAEIAATLAMSAARSSDKVALLLFSDQVELYLPARKGRRHILRMFRELIAFEPKHSGTDIAAALTFLNHVVHRRSLVFLLTDFLHSFGSESTHAGSGRDVLQEIGLTNARHDLICLHLKRVRWWNWIRNESRCAKDSPGLIPSGWPNWIARFNGQVSIRCALARPEVSPSNCSVFLKSAGADDEGDFSTFHISESNLVRRCVWPAFLRSVALRPGRRATNR